MSDIRLMCCMLVNISKQSRITLKVCMSDIRLMCCMLVKHNLGRH